MSRVPRPSVSLALAFAGRAFAVLTLVLSGCALALSHSSPAQAADGPPASPLAAAAISFAPIIDKSIAAVVSVSVKGKAPIEHSPLYHHPLFSRFGLRREGPPQTKPFVSSGSATIVDATRGIILSNEHTITKADEVRVTLADGRELKAEIVGTDPATDVAVLRVPPKDLASISLGNSDGVRRGDLVIAIGAPFGLQGTATLGMVSAVMRSGVGYENYESFIQIDAAVNSGNSGGALIDQRGDLIGITTAILSPDEGNVGVGFAIPIKMAMQVAEQILRDGRVRRGQLGVRTRDLTPELVREKGLSVHQGALVTAVRRDSPAAVAELLVGDVVLSINGRPTPKAADLATQVALLELGAKARLEVHSKGATRAVDIGVAELKPEPDRLVVPPSVQRMAGVVLGTLEPGMPRFGEIQGAQVLELRRLSRAALSGLAVGDIIDKFDGYKVRSPEELVKLAKDKPGRHVLKVLRDGVPITITLR